MAVIRRHWRMAVAQVLLLAVCCAMVAWYLSSHPAAAVETANQAAGKSTKVDPLKHSRLSEVRRAACLSNEDLAAMGCDTAAARRMLEALATWYDANEGAFGQAENVAISSSRRMSAAVLQMQVGPPSDVVARQVPALQGEVHQSHLLRKALSDSAASAVAQHMGTEQAAVWATARANAGLPQHLRYVPSLSRAEMKQIEDARASARDPVAADLAEKSILGDSRRAASDAAWAKVRSHFSLVAKAEREVIPIPRELEAKPTPTATSLSQ